MLLNVANRPKDLDFILDLAHHDLIDRNTLQQRLNKTDLSKSERSRIQSRIEATFASSWRLHNSTDIRLVC